MKTLFFVDFLKFVIYNIYMNTLLFNSLRFQIGGSIILGILEIIYFFRPKLKLLSNRIFTILMLSAAFYLMFDFATVFALLNYHSLPMWFVRFTHQGFVFFLVIALSSIFFYLDFLNRNQKYYSIRGRVFVIILHSVTLISIIFAPLDYYIGEDGIYSYGMMANIVYMVIIVCLVMTVTLSIRNLIKRKNIRLQIYVLCTMTLWACFGIFQMLHPMVLISSIGMAAMILLMFLSLENPNEYIDRDTGAFNILAMKSVISSHTINKKPFMIVNVIIDEAPFIGNDTDTKGLLDFISSLKHFIKKNLHTDMYRLNKTSVAFILDEKHLDKADDYLSLLETRFKGFWKINGNLVRMTANANVISCPEDFPFDGGIDELLDFMEDITTYAETSSFVRRTDEKSRARRIRRLKIIKLLTDAIKKDCIEIYYQPIYCLKKKSFTNVEALVRLKDSTSIGYISPEEFIPIAEKHGMIIELSDKIFHHVFGFMAKNNLREKGVTHVEVNLSGLQSVDANLPLLMKNLLNQYKIEPECVNLEITESIAVTSGYMLKKNMDELRKFGCSFAMDDFGTGYSNLSRISKGEFELIKIDKSLLWPCFDKGDGKDVRNAKILLENMISMLLKMEREIVVEGIETKEQFDYLDNLGITYAQGFYFSKPVPEKDYLEFIHKAHCSEDGAV